VYYAGHGIEIDGNNYLIPTDAKLRRDIDVDDDAVSLERVLKVIEPARRLRLVILDACRENPFVKTMKRTITKRAIGRGLASVEPTLSDTLIAFAAKAGSTAEEGNGLHSPFTTALLRHLVTPGLDVRLAFGKVRDDVMRETSYRQEPFVYGSLGGSVVTLASLTTEERPPILDPNAEVARDYETAAKLNTEGAWGIFLKAHPKGFYADLARAQRAKLSSLSPTTPEPEKHIDPASRPKKLQDKKLQEKSGPRESTFQCCMSHMRVMGNLAKLGTANTIGACKTGIRQGIKYCNFIKGKWR